MHDLEGTNEVNLNSGFQFVQPFDQQLDLEDMQVKRFVFGKSSLTLWFL